LGLPPTERVVRRRRSAVLVVIAALLHLAGAVPAFAAGLVDPLLRFRQLRTEHFIIYFHEGEEGLARRLAGMAESVRTDVARSLGSSVPRLTHVILADQSETANGWASPIPRNTVFLNAAVPSGAEVIGRTDDWLRLVFTHEFTHVVHLDRSGSWAWLVRGIIGRSPIVFPNLWLPEWQIEGLATWEESALTGQGRRAAGDFRAIEQVAALSGRPLTIDRSSGGLVGWPDGHAAYAAGLGFHEYLVDRFGQESLGRLSTATSRWLPFLGTRAYRSVYGQSLGTLWRDYQQHLRESATDAPVSPAQRLTHHGDIVSGPRFAPAPCDTCPRDIVYSLLTQHDFPSLRAVSETGANDRQLTTRYLGSTAGISEAFIVFDQQEVRRDVGLYSDLYALDRRTGKVETITHEARLQDPDLSPASEFVAAVRENRGQRDLVIVRIESRGSPVAKPSRTGEIVVLAAEPGTQYSAPRWSPDARLLAVERRRQGTLPDVVVIETATREIVRTFADAGARVVTPAWRPDGQAVVAAADFDGGSFDLYEFPIEAGAPVRRLTRTRGALWPDVSPDAATIVFAGYDANGYDLYSVPYATIAQGEPRTLAPGSVAVRSVPENVDPPVASYSPFATLFPTSWTPIVFWDSDQTRIGAETFGSDILGRHAWAVSATWLARGLEVARPLPASTPDWSVNYAYTRWRPVPFASMSRETLFRGVRTAPSGQPITVAATQYEEQAGLFVPVIHARRNTQVVGALVRTDVTYRLPDSDRAISVVASRFAAAYDSAQQYGYSISREHGIDVGATIEMAREAIGSDADATTTTLDARAYLPGLHRHHVIAVRAAGGLSRGADLARQTFTLSSVAASPSVIDFGSDALALMRSASSADVGGDRLVVANVEYRLPLAVIERGYGTWPLFLRTAHASMFADVGQLRVAGSGNRRWAHALGGELSIDGVAGYALPFAASLGLGWGQDSRGARGFTLFARLGRAF
jgi:hypothetical protein